LSSSGRAESVPATRISKGSLVIWSPSSRCDI
jgi:hypothetical protein